MKCNRAVCHNEGVLLHKQNGHLYCVRCARRINEANGGVLFDWPTDGHPLRQHPTHNPQENTMTETANLSDTYSLYMKLGGHEVNYTDLSRSEAANMRDNRLTHFKDCVKDDDLVILENKRTGVKAYWRPTKTGLVRCHSYAWAITKDVMPQEGAKEGTVENAVGLTGPRYGLPLTYDEIVKHPKGKKFRMLTDDDEILYEGVFVDENDKYDGFEPKDDFGEPNAGCTTIEYLEDGVWKTL
jgi:hypothetical protein